ncbi:MAG: 4-demethylwyosine synthase TYW1 [Candidatus Diapherotrites archaeon]
MLDLTEKQKEELRKKQYGLKGHAAVQVCKWNKDAILGKGVCYKQKFYSVDCHKCLQFTPVSLWCSENCVFCWRTMELMKTVKLKKSDVLDPKDFVDALIEERKKLLSGFPGNPKTDLKKFREALEPNHYAISLSGEPTLYPKLPELVNYLRKEKKARTIFIVSNGQEPKMLEKMKKEKALPDQLYISLAAPNEKIFKRINAPIYKDAWKRLMKTLSLLHKLKTRTVLRITLINGKNNLPELIPEWKNLILKAKTDFIEVKSYMHLGYSRKRLDKENMLSFEEVKFFAEALTEGTDYVYKSDSEKSIIVLLKNKKSKKPDFFT